MVQMISKVRHAARSPSQHVLVEHGTEHRKERVTELEVVFGEGTTSSAKSFVFV